jgi:proton-dependent oligopeptide transporter, POT family
MEHKTLAQIQAFKGQYPKQIWALFFSEMWERFSFYGMRGMLVVFMVSQLHMNETSANLQYGATQALVYAFTFVGGLLADKFLGFSKSLFWGGALMIVGSVLLAIDPQQFFFLGIAFTVVGTGFFKPNISSIVGKLYHENDHRRDAGFSLFYAGVNIGGLLGGYLCIAVANGNLLADSIAPHLRWHVAFGFAAVFMLVSLINYALTKHKLGAVLDHESSYPENTQKRLQISTYIGSLLAIPLIIFLVENNRYTDIFMKCIGPLALAYLIYEVRNSDAVARKKVAAALCFVVFSVVFWAFFEQSGGSLSLFANANLQNNIMGITLDPVGVNNSANSLFVIIFAGLLGLLWLALAKRKKEPNSVVKFGLGFLFLALGFYVFYLCRFLDDGTGKSSLGVFTMAWLFLSIGELCLSPIGMSVMTKLSPAKSQSVMMGIWFLASAYGQYFAGLLGADISKDSEHSSLPEKLIVYCDGYFWLSIYALIAGVLMIFLAKFIKKLMQGVA